MSNGGQQEDKTFTTRVSFSTINIPEHQCVTAITMVSLMAINPWPRSQWTCMVYNAVFTSWPSGCTGTAKTAQPELTTSNLMATALLLLATPQWNCTAILTGWFNACPHPILAGTMDGSHQFDARVTSGHANCAHAMFIFWCWWHVCDCATGNSEISTDTYNERWCTYLPQHKTIPY